MKTYYIDASTQAGTGSYNDPLILSQATSTFYQALDPGDEIVFKPGLFVGQLSLNGLRGTADYPITVRWLDSATLDGDYRYPLGKAANETKLDIKRSTYSHGLKNELPFVWSGLLQLKNCSFVNLISPTILNSRGRSINLELCDNITITEAQAVGCRNAFMVVTQTENINVQNSVFRDGGNFFPYSRSVSLVNWPVGINQVNSKNFIFDGNSVSEHWGEGITSGKGCYGMYFSKNRIYNNAKMGVYLHMGFNSVWTDNLIYHTQNTPYVRGTKAPVAVVLNQEGKNFPNNHAGNITFKNNLIHWVDNTALAFWNNQGSDHVTKNVDILNNTFMSNVAPFHNIGNGSAFEDLIVENNVFVNYDQQSPIIVNSGSKLTSSQVTFRHNSWSQTPTDPKLNTSDSLIGIPAFEGDILKPLTSNASVNPADYNIVDGSNGFRTEDAEEVEEVEEENKEALELSKVIQALEQIKGILEELLKAI
jgi:hypothetical protein